MAQPPRNGKPLISFSDEELELLRIHKLPTEPQDKDNEEDDEFLNFLHLVYDFFIPKIEYFLTNFNHST